MVSKVLRDMSIKMEKLRGIVALSTEYLREYCCVVINDKGELDRVDSAFCPSCQNEKPTDMFLNLDVIQSQHQTFCRRCRIDRVLRDD